MQTTTGETIVVDNGLKLAIQRLKDKYNAEDHETVAQDTFSSARRIGKKPELTMRHHEDLIWLVWKDLFIKAKQELLTDRIV